jgi:hypothetical protein
VILIKCYTTYSADYLLMEKLVDGNLTYCKNVIHTIGDFLLRKSKDLERVTTGDE